MVRMIAKTAAEGYKNDLIEGKETADEVESIT